MDNTFEQALDDAFKTAKPLPNHAHEGMMWNFPWAYVDEHVMNVY